MGIDLCGFDAGVAQDFLNKSFPLVLFSAYVDWMSKKLCKDADDISKKRNGRKNRYICNKCDMKSPKEKWCCKPMEVKQ